MERESIALHCIGLLEHASDTELLWLRLPETYVEFCVS
jgi:hypothetical protein